MYTFQRLGCYLLFLPLIFLVSCQEKRPIIMGMELGDGIYANIRTNKGDILCRLAMDKAPLTVANFVGLCEGTIPNTLRQNGESYFDGILWHRVDRGFVIQAGDPNTLPSGNPGRIGMGGPGYKFRNEINPDLTHKVAGTLAMANSGPNTNGSQFYITQSPTPNLDGSYNVFGYVSRGMETVMAIQRNDTIKHIQIYRVGGNAKKFDSNKVFNQLQ